MWRSHRPSLPAPSACSSAGSFFVNDTATTEIYTLSLHDALPIWIAFVRAGCACGMGCGVGVRQRAADRKSTRLNSITSGYLVCRLLLEKKHSRSGGARMGARLSAPHPRTLLLPRP